MAVNPRKLRTSRGVGRPITRRKIMPIAPKPATPPAAPAATAPAVTPVVKPKKPVVNYTPVPKTPQDFIQQQLGRIQTEADRHQQYADQSANWLAEKLSPIQHQTEANAQNYQAYLKQAGGIAASADQLQGSMPGYGASLGKAIEVPAGIRASIGAQGSAGAIASMIANQKKYATDLPAVYAQYANDYTAKMQQWAMSFQQQIGGGSGKVGGYAPGTPAPAGYVAVPRSDGGVDFVPDKTFTSPLDAAKFEASQAKAAASAASKSAGYKGQTAEQYRTNYQKWVTNAEKMLTVPYDTGQVGADGKTMKATRTPKAVFDMIVQSGIRPSDALRMVEPHANFSAQEAVNWLKKYLPEKNAITVVQQMTGIRVAASPTRGTQPMGPGGRSTYQPVAGYKKVTLPANAPLGFGGKTLTVPR